MWKLKQSKKEKADSNTEIQIYDPISTCGHKNYNTRLIEICLKLAPCRVFYANPELNLQIDNPPHRLIFNNTNQLYTSRFALVYIHCKMLRNLKKHYTSSNLFICFDNVSMFLACLFTLNRKTINLVCHNNLHRAQASKLSKLALRLLKYFGVQLIILENSFKDDVKKQLGYAEKNIHIVYHPLPKIKRLEATDTFNRKSHHHRLTVSYLSGAYSDKGFDILLRAIKRYLEDKSRSDKGQIKFNLLLKKPVNLKLFGLDNICLSEHQINLICNKINDADYQSLLKESDYICLPFRETFNNRCSAALFEALVCEKKLILAGIPLFTYYAQKHNLSDHIFTPGNAGQLKDIFLCLEQKEPTDSHKPDFINLRRDAIISKQLRELLSIQQFFHNGFDQVPV